jgi:outer membrane receptor protein involved in Fe transport
MAASAQSPKGTILGRVTDPSGAVVAKAKVALTQQATGVTQTQETSPFGEYVFTNLDPGRYRIETEAAGFTRNVVTNLELNVAATVRADIVLQVGETATTVEVEAPVPVVQTDSTSIGSVVDGRQVMNMPLNGRGNFYALLALAPGVQGAGSNPIISGGTWFGSTNQAIDGMTNNDNGNERLNPTTPSLDAIAEFKVIANAASAEFGRGGAQVIMVTRSGSNEVHGTLFWFNRNRITAAKNFFATGLPLPPFNRNEYGASVGGPVVRNRLFYFASFEGLRRNVATTTVTAQPPTAFLQGDFSALPSAIRDPFAGGVPFPGNRIPSTRISPVAGELNRFFSVPNTPATGPGGTGLNFTFNTPTREVNDRYSGRIDYHATARDRLTFRYFRADNGPWLSGVGNGTDRIGNWRGFGLLTDSGLASYTRILSPSLLNEFRVGILRNEAFRTPQNSDFDPSRIIPGLTPPLPGLGGVPTVNILGFRGLSDQPGSGDVMRSTEFSDIVTWTRGRQSWKFGFEFQRAFAFNFQNVLPAPRGVFSFDGRYTGYSFADYLVGAMWQSIRNSRQLEARPTNNRYAAFAQNDWTLTPTLTLNAGLRYEMYGLFYNGLGDLSNFYPDLGAVVVLNGNPIQRLVETLPIIQGRDVGLDDSNYITRDRNNFAPRLGLAWRPLKTNRLVLRSSYGIFYVVPPAYVGFFQMAANPPFLVQENFDALPGATPNLTWANPFPGVGAIPTNVSVQGNDRHRVNPYFQQWNFTLESELMRNTALRVSYVGNKGTRLLRNMNVNDPPPAPGAVQPRRPYQPFGPISLYQAAANSITNQIQVGIQRRFSGGLQFQLEYQYTKGLQEQPFGISPPMDNRNARLDRGDADFVRRHYAVANYIYDLPWWRGKRLGGWQLTGIITAGTGQPFSPLFTSQVLGWSAGATTTFRPDIVGDPKLANPTIDRWFNPDAYAPPAPFTFGNAARNSLFGPGLFTWDAGILKFTPLTEQVTLEFRAESFNLTNRANFGLPASNISVPAQVGRITSTATDARTFNFGLRLRF